jgi:hypothetical protein
MTISQTSDTEPEPSAAADAARRGWAVFPVRRGDKRPAVPDWENRSCSDPERVARHWPAGANVGIACGPSGLVVLDLDCHGDLPEEWQLPGIRDGRDVLAQLCEWAQQDWPVTYTVNTPSGGQHLYFTAPDDDAEADWSKARERWRGQQVRNSASLIGPQIDVRARGGYVLGAGSAVGGKPYVVIDGNAPAALPRWIARALTQRHLARQGPAQGDPAARLRGILRTVVSAPAGQRNDALYWAARRGQELVTADGADPAMLTEALITAAAAAGLDEREARRTVASGMRGEL